MRLTNSLPSSRTAGEPGAPGVPGAGAVVTAPSPASMLKISSGFWPSSRLTTTTATSPRPPILTPPSPKPPGDWPCLSSTLSLSRMLRQRTGDSSLRVLCGNAVSLRRLAPGPPSESQRDADDGGVAIDVGLVRHVVVGKRVAGEEGVSVFREEGHESDESNRQAGAELAADLEIDAIAGENAHAGPPVR